VQVGELFLMEEVIDAMTLQDGVRRATVALKFVPIFMGRHAPSSYDPNHAQNSHSGMVMWGKGELLAKVLLLLFQLSHSGPIEGIQLGIQLLASSKLKMSEYRQPVTLLQMKKS